MNTLSDMRTAVLSDLNASANSSLFPTATVNRALNRSYIKVAGYFRWSDLEDAKTTTTQADEVIDVPDAFRYNSVWRVVIDGEIYGEKPDGSPMDFKDYLEWKADNSTSTLKKWTQYRNQLFIHPTPTAGLTIIVWGQRNITEMTDDADTTIFSSNLPEVNEAIVLEAEAILKLKGKDMDGRTFASEEAKALAINAFNKVKMEKSKYEKTQPFLNVPDFFGDSGTEDYIGNFVDND